MFDDNVRATLLNWYVGEVQLLASDILPDASGETLRAGTARESFIQVLQGFYKTLKERAETKSVRVSLVKNLRKAEAAVEAIEGNKGGGVDEAQKQIELANIVRAVELLDRTSKKGKPSNIADQRLRAALKDPQVRKARESTRKVLTEKGYLQKYARTTKPKTGKTTKRQASGTPATGQRETDAIGHLSVEEFQARVGRLAPRLKSIGLSTSQIEEVLELLRDLVA